jgi:protein subunit release factor A
MKENKKDLLFSVKKSDFKITFFSGTGKGGQHRNRHKNCVRIMHIETGIIKTGQSQRSLEQNKNEALSSFLKDKKFMQWLMMKTASAKVNQDELNETVDRQMRPGNLKIEKFDSDLDKWVRVESDAGKTI